MREKAGRNPKAEGGRRKTKTESRKLILRNFQSPGDIVMLTAAVRDLHRCYPGRYWWICSASVSEHRAGRFVVFRKQRNAVNAIMAQAKQFRPLFENPPADMPPEEELLSFPSLSALSAF